MSLAGKQHHRVSRVGNTRWPFALTAILSGIIIATASAPAATPMAGITSSNKFVIYYGNDFTTNNLTALAKFDVVVIDANVGNCRPSSVAYLQTHGVKYVLAYLSIGEEPASVAALAGNGDGPVHFSGGTYHYESNNVASFYVDQEWNGSTYVSDGIADTNIYFGGRFIWPNSDWRWVLDNQRIGGSAALPGRSLAGLQQLLGSRTSDSDSNRNHNFGLDGVFLDTLDTAGPFQNTWGYYAWAAPEMQQTVKFIHDTYTNRTVLANRGNFFYNPTLWNSTYNIRPYDYTVRPYVNGTLFESYTLDSDGGNPGISVYFGENKNNYAPKMIAEANRPDGFTLFCVDYQMSRSNSLYQQAALNSVVSNGWVEYLPPDGGLATIGTYMLSNPPPADTAAPVWDSTAANSSTPVPPRVGIQSVSAGANIGDVIIRWDVARDQTPPVKYNIYQSTDPSFSTYVAYSNVVFQVGDGWSTDPVTAFANQYTVTGLSAGAVYFRVRAQDSSAGAYEDTNVVTLSINVGGTQYNPVAAGGLVVDGDLSDWASLVSFGSAAQTFTPTTTNPVELAQLWVAHDVTNFYVAYQNYGPTTNGLNAAYNLYLDTDGSRPTGYRGGGNNFPIGADYLLQGSTLYRYAGSNGTDWSWSLVGVASSAVTGSNVEFSLPRSWIGNPLLANLFFLGDNPALPGGIIVDQYPNNALLAGGGGPYVTYRVTDVANAVARGGITVNGGLSDWTGLRSFGLDPQSIVIDSNNQVDLAQVWMAHDATNYYVAYQNYGPITSNALGWAYTLYLDTDGNRSTGFRGGLNNFPIGADYILEGATVYQYTGTNGTDWSWNLVGTAAWAASGSNVEFSLPRIWIGNPSLVKLFFWGDNSAYGGTAQDLYPGGALNVGGGGAYLVYRIADVSNPLGAGAIAVNGNLSDWAARTSFGLESQAFSTTASNPVDLAQLWVAHNATNFYVAYQNYGTTTNGLNAAYNLYLDTDNNRSTGFRGGSDNFPIGVEYLLQGNTVYQYTGSGVDWSWLQIGIATSAVAGSNVEFSLPRAWIENPSILGLFFLGDNQSIGGSFQDVYPDSALQVGGGGGRFTYRVLPTSQNMDSVGDGIPDSWRQQYFDFFGDGTTTNSSSCASCDPDGDGLNNLQEYLAGTNPTNGASAFRIISVARVGADIRVTWMTGAGRTNILQATPNLSETYSNVSPEIITTGSDSTVTNYLDAGVATNAPTRYYRVRLVP